MSYNPQRVSRIKEIREATGLSLREAADMHDKYQGDVEGIIARHQRYQEQRITVGSFDSKLQVVGYIVEYSSPTAARISGKFYHGAPSQESKDIILSVDPGAVFKELVYKADADELIGMMGA